MSDQPPREPARFRNYLAEIAQRELGTLADIRCQRPRCYHRFVGAFGRWPDGTPVVNHCPRCDAPLDLEEAA